MLIALFGGCCSGKTTIARKLGIERGMVVRHCGPRVVEEAKGRQLHPSELGIEVHKHIDEETVQWAKTNSTGLSVVDGRFLHYVLADFSLPMFLVNCTASANFRQECLDKRQYLSEKKVDVASLDQEDAALCRLLFDAKKPRPSDLSIDVSQMSVEECVERIMCKIKP